MTKRLLGFLFLFLPMVAHSHHHPDSQGHEFLPGIDFRWIQSKDSTTYLVSSKLQKSLNPGYEVHWRMGARYRLSRHWKLGFFYGAQWNRRNNDNWVWDKYGWQRVGMESLLEPELSYRSLLTDSLRFEWRSTYQVNLRYGQQNLKMRFGLDQFLQKKSNRVDNMFLAVEAYQPLNYARHQINETWVYAGYLWQLANNDRTGLAISYADWIWRESTTYQTASYPYQIRETALLLNWQYIWLEH